ncbi:hypothetical protein DFQ15_1084 [Xylophilus ampelinus]|uniref:Uncharacterized protein n=1 Tax=Xylophilus ampelinus TaxID=54067 RepID=A0A318SLS3_9BURK|nr:hypothetical protein DFQ15_1084 [Xylophilus ampelinus]
MKQEGLGLTTQRTQQGFTLSDLAMEEALHDMPLFVRSQARPGTRA